MSGDIKLLPGVSLARITPPPVPPHFIYRGSIIALLNKPAPRANFLIAPSGYGKTTVAAQWAASSDIPVVWYSVDPTDSPKDALFHLICAYRRVEPKFAPWAEVLVDQDFDPVSIAVKIANEIAMLPGTYRQIIDNLDEFGPEHFDANQAFTNSAPLNLQTISIRKTAPDISYARAASLDAVSMFTAADLKFGDEEIIAVAQVHNLDVNDKRIIDSLNLAHGWAAGVALIAAAFERRYVPGLINEVFQGIKTSEGIVARAIDTIGEKDRLLLSQLCLLDKFTESDAHSIVETSDLARQLQNLMNSGIFLSRTSENPSVYEENRLVREELRRRLLLNKSSFKSIAHKSAIVAEQQGNALLALELYGSAGEMEEATRLAVSNLQHLVYQANIDLLRKWAPTISKALGGGSLGENMINIYGLFSIGKFDETKAALREIDTGLPTGPEGEVIRYEIAMIRMRMELLYGHFKRVHEQHAQLLEQPSSDFGRDANTQISKYRNPLIAAFYMWDVETFRKHYEVAQLTFEFANSAISKMLVHSFKAMHAFLEGNYFDANEYAYSACRIAADNGIQGSYFPYEAAYVLIDTQLEFGLAENSQRNVDTFLPYAIKYNQYPWVAAFYARDALIKLQEGNISMALTMIRRGREAVAGPLFGDAMSFQLDGTELLVRSPLGDTERISELIYRLPHHPLVQGYKAGMELQKNPQAIEKYNDMLPSGTIKEKFYKELFLATAYISSRPKAISHLENAIEMAIPNGYFRAFLNLPTELKNYLLEISTKKPTVYMENLARAIREQSHRASTAGTLASTSLTKRELDILRRLATGIPISQIAASVHISQNTIKTHLKNLYRKMNVESRAEAVERGKQLSLL